VETLRLCADCECAETPSSGSLSFAECNLDPDKQPRQLGHDRTIVFFNDSEQFHWVTRQMTCSISARASYVRRTITCMATTRDCRRESCGSTAIANFDGWSALKPGRICSAETALVRPHDASAVRFLPDFRNHVIDTDMFTPTTIHRYTWHERGAVYGAPEKRHDGTTHLSNLFLCGTDQGYVASSARLSAGSRLPTATACETDSSANARDFLDGVHDQYDVTVIGSGLAV